MVERRGHGDSAVQALLRFQTGVLEVRRQYDILVRVLFSRQASITMPARKTRLPAFRRGALRRPRAPCGGKSLAE